MEETKDTQDMDLDELEAFINNAQNPSEEVVESETEVEEPVEPEAPEIEESPYTKGKSRQDLLDIIENGTKKISQQGNEIFSIKQTLDELKQKVEKPPVKEDDELSNYAPDDLKIIEKVVERKLSARQEAEVERKNKLINEAKEYNEIAFDVIPKDEQDAMLPEMMEMFKADPDNTLHRKGWVKEFYHSWKNRAPEAEAPVKRKVVQVIGGSSQKPTVKKSVDEMSPDEYLEYCKTIGLNIGS